MPSIEQLFPTFLYRHKIAGPVSAPLNRDLKRACRLIAEEDAAGRSWSRAHGYAGYTSYASLTDLTDRAPAFTQLAGHLDKHAKACAEAFAFDLKGRMLVLDSLWINVLAPGGVHSGHIHPHSVLSGTYYVAIPKEASAIRFEDPRLGFMMAAPKRSPRARREWQPFFYVEPEAGTLLLWESWLRHEVVQNRAGTGRISVSFNYRLEAKASSRP